MRALVAAAAFACAAFVAISGAARADTVMQTTTTRFSYNADGTPTAVSTQPDSQPATTTYLTWGNYRNGSVQPGNGNLLAFGPNADGSQPTAQFSYDARDRLIGVTAGGQSVDYTYSAANILASSTLGSGDTVQFYYGNGRAPQMSDLYHPATDGWASFLGPVRHLSDGTEQALLAPRKDTAGVYEPKAQTLAGYQYDAYGTRTDGAGACAAADQYDLADNPFQHTGEYRDPTWCGTYLRARWYLPVLQTFLQRDPVDLVQRYGYAGGNPIMHTDPTGLSWRKAARGFDKFSSSGWGTGLSVLPYVGEALFAGQFIFNVSNFFHNPRSAEMFGFSLAAGVLAGGRDFGAAEQLDRLAGARIGFGARLGTDVAIGAGMSAMAATGGKHNRFDAGAFIENMALTAAGIGAARGVGQVGYRYSLSADDVERHVVAKDEALVFKVRSRRNDNNVFSRWKEWRSDGVFIVMDDQVHFLDMRKARGFDERFDVYRQFVRPNPARRTQMLEDLADDPNGPGRRIEFSFLGRVPKSETLQTIEAMHNTEGTGIINWGGGKTEYSQLVSARWWHTSSGYASSIVRGLAPQ